MSQKPQAVHLRHPLVRLAMLIDWRRFAEKHLGRVAIDTTVQPKAVTHPTDGKLLRRGIEILGRLARRQGVALRQSYVRVVRAAKREAAKLMHSGSLRHVERQVRRLRTWLGRLARDITCKITGNTAAAVAGPLKAASSTGDYLPISLSPRSAGNERWSSSLGHGFGFYKWIAPLFPFSD